MILETGFPPVPFLGIRTFYYLAAIMYKIGIIQNFPSYSIAWVNLDGNSSNVFTCFGRYYADFGIIGVVILSIAAGFILTAIFNVACRTKYDLFILLSVYISPYVFDMAREEFVFSRLISPTQIIAILIMLLIAYFLLGNNSEDVRKVNKYLKVNQWGR